MAFIEHHQPSALEDKNKDRETIVIIVADLLLELKTPAKEKPLTKAKKNSLGHKDPLTGPGKGRPRSNGDSIIVKVSKENPRKEGTHGWNSWNLLKPKITVDEYIAAGGRGNDLRWDIDKGHCVLDETPELFKK